MPIKINVKNCLLYILYAALSLFLNGAVAGVPLALCLYFPMLICGGNAILSPLIYVACSAVHFNLTAFLCSLPEAGFLLAVTLIYRRTARKIKYEAAAYMCVALAPFVIFSEWTGMGGGFSFSNPYIARGIAAAVVLVFTLFGYKAVYAVIFRLGRCRLKEDELICSAAVYAAAGTGAVNLTGNFACLAFTLFAIAICIRFFKSPAALVCTAVMSIPSAITQLSLAPFTAYTVICLFSLIFCHTGRASSFVTGLAVCAYAFLEGYFDGGTVTVALRAVILAACAAVAAIPSEKYLKKLKDKITLKNELTDTAVNRERERTGEKLFRISQVFREIECAFKSMDEAADDYAVKKRIFTELRESCCKECPKREKCGGTTVYAGFGKLIDTGTVKGKITIIDLPPDVTRNCNNPALIINNLNGLLAEYMRYMTEAENARLGRILLADQAKGVSLVLKNCAVDLCKRTASGGREEKLIQDRLASYGISCPEIIVSGGENAEVSAVICGKVNIETCERAIEQAVGGPFALKDKISYDGEKSCYIFARPPRLDAVFGVATVRKNGESASGDTHTVIRINEYRFMMALSDGMGSGEYARKVSRTAISLIEAFYRAEMPEGTVLDTINKLITFSRDERFTCIDIGSVNLNDGCAELIKIGSPVTVIMREGEIRVVESQSLPLGILDDLRPTVAREELKDGDFLVFMSDGITEAFSSTPELVEFLQPLKPLNPQSLADKILEGALGRTGGTAADDMTVLCTRMFTTPAYLGGD